MRAKPGAKPKANKKVHVTVYLRESVIANYGGMAGMRKEITDRYDPEFDATFPKGGLNNYI